MWSSWVASRDCESFIVFTGPSGEHRWQWTSTKQGKYTASNQSCEDGRKLGLREGTEKRHCGLETGDMPIFGEPNNKGSSTGSAENSCGDKLKEGAGPPKIDKRCHTNIFHFVIFKMTVSSYGLGHTFWICQNPKEVVNVFFSLCPHGDRPCHCVLLLYDPSATILSPSSVCSNLSRIYGLCSEGLHSSLICVALHVSLVISFQFMYQRRMIPQGVGISMKRWAWQCTNSWSSS